MRLKDGRRFAPGRPRLNSLLFKRSGRPHALPNPLGVEQDRRVVAALLKAARRCSADSAGTETAETVGAAFLALVDAELVAEMEPYRGLYADPSEVGFDWSWIDDHVREFEVPVDLDNAVTSDDWSPIAVGLIASKDLIGRLRKKATRARVLEIIGSATSTVTKGSAIAERILAACYRCEPSEVRGALDAAMRAIGEQEALRLALHVLQTYAGDLDLDVLRALMVEAEKERRAAKKRSEHQARWVNRWKVPSLRVLARSLEQSGVHVTDGNVVSPGWKETPHGQVLRQALSLHPPLAAGYVPKQ